MRIAEIALATVLLLDISDASAYANIAKIPVSIRQTYSDGTATELACKTHDSCTLTVHENGVERLTLMREYFGYSTSGAMTDYLYWPNSGDDLVISIEVECKDGDLALVQDPDPHCRMYLQRKDAGFMAERIEVWPRDGNPVSHEFGIAP